MLNKKQSSEVDKTGKQPFIKRGFFRYGLPAVLPVITAVCTAVAALNEAPVRIYWSAGVVVTIAASTFISVFKERAAAHATQLAIDAKASLTEALLSQWQPLMRAVLNVTAAKSLTDKEKALNGLFEVTLGLGSTMFSENSEKDRKTRATLYLFEDDPEKNDDLHRECTRGRSGAPNLPLVITRSMQNRKSVDVERDTATIDVALGEDAILVKSAAGHESTKENKFGFESGILVPVQTKDFKFGLFLVDSNQEASFSDNDKDHVILMASALGAGLADVATYKAVSHSTATQPARDAHIAHSNNNVPSARISEEETKPVAKPSNANVKE
ncbi:hypothetical protein GBF35_50435 [Nonomuraea phyllanthi]|uniref:hypothetical protein n=1 Tax=Nonomuraea phyllanthi TaxID=2219224 RepID=UPI0012938EEB|nr:hypothetical protein [Nonomuraea phyllanthi]QFY13700.1 hypothetical protein GBF35_50435 [Nonomuraea phyllanthi]